MSDLPSGAVIEIIERTDNPDPKFIVPNDVRINGVSVLVAGEDPVEVHGFSMTSTELVRVTLTLIARRVVIGSEDK